MVDVEVERLDKISGPGRAVELMGGSAQQPCGGALKR